MNDKRHASKDEATGIPQFLAYAIGSSYAASKLQEVVS